MTLFRSAVTSITFSIILLFLATASESTAQQSSRGREFYFSFLPNLHNGGLQSDDSLWIYVVADSATTGTLTYTNRNGTSFTQNIVITNPNVIWQRKLQWSSFELLGYNQSTGFSTNNDLETPAPQVFRVQTDRNVACYALNKALTTSDASLILPSALLGKEYYVMSYKSDGVAFGGSPDLQYTPSQFCVIAVDSNTVVSVNTTAPTTETGSAVKNFTLQKGQAYLFQSEYSTSNLRYDLTGSRIQASKPVAVFAGHQRATLPVEQRGTLISRDHLYEQLLPTSVWGRSYIITPLGQPSGSNVAGSDLWRVVAQEDGTTLNFNNVQVATLNRGQYYETALNTAGLLVASKNVQVALFKKTHSSNQTLQPGDPFMMIIPPRRQYLNDYRFTNIQATPAFNEQFITVVTTKSNSTSIQLDGAALNATFLDIPNTCFSYANIRVNSANHRIQSPQPIGLYVYGFGDADSYGYVGGLALQADLAEVDIDAGPDRLICLGDTARLRVVGAASKVKWTPSTGLNCDTCINVVAKPTQNTSYIVTALDSLGCTQIDTINVIVRKFLINAGRDTSLCPGGDSVRLTVVGVNGEIIHVNWTPKIGLACDTCLSTKVQPTVTTNYIAVAIDSLGCIGRDTVKVTIRPGLSIDAGPDQEFCSAADSVVLKATFANGVIKKVKWSPSTGLGCDTCVITRARPSTGMTYYVTVFDSSGCSGTDSVKIKLKSSSGAVHLAAETFICFKNDSAVLQIQGKVMSVKWTPKATVTCDTCPLTYAKPTVSTTYYCNGVDAQGCLFTDSIKVTPLPAATVDIQPDSTACTSTGIALRAIGSYSSISWTPTVGLSCSNCPTPVAIPPGRDVTYVVRVRNGSSPDCEAVDSVTVKYRPGIEGQLPSTVTSCLGDTLRYNIKFGGSVKWTPSTNLACDTCKSVVIVPKGNIKYTITGDSAGCTSKITLDIKMSQRATLKAPVDTSICRGDTIELVATSNSTTNPVEWLPYTGLSCPTCLKTKASPRRTTTYVVTSGAGLCATRDTITITVKDAPVAQLSPQDTSLCGGGSVQYLLTLATTGSTLRWSPAEGLSCVDCPNPVATPTRPGKNTYTLSIFGPNGCDTTIVATIGVGAPPRDTLVTKDTTICEGASIVTRVIGDTSASFFWTPSNGVACQTCAQTRITADTVRRWYYLRAKDAGSGCIKIDSFLLSAAALPRVDSTSGDTSLCQKQSVQLHTNSALSYRWSPASSLDRSDIQNPTASPSVTTTYTVILTNAAGCIDSAKVTVDVQPCGDSITVTQLGSIAPFLACDSTDTFLRIRNLGQIAIQVDSVTVLRRNNADVDLVALAAENASRFPTTLQPGAALSPEFALRILALNPGSFSITLRVWTANKSRIDSVVISSSTTQLPVLFKLDSTSVTIDSSFAFPVHGISKYWTELRIRAVDVRVQYAPGFMVYDTAKVIVPGTLSDNTWQFSYDKAASSNGVAVFHAIGTTPLKSLVGTEGILFTPYFRTMLSNDILSRPTLRFDLPSLSVPCAERLVANGEVNIVTCAASLRRIQVRLSDFKLISVVPNPVVKESVAFQYGVGTPGDICLKIYDELGRDVLTVFNTYHDGGIYEATLDVSSLANGSYHCVLSSGGLQFSKRLQVTR